MIPGCIFLSKRVRSAESSNLLKWARFPLGLVDPELKVCLPKLKSILLVGGEGERKKTLIWIVFLFLPLEIELNNKISKRAQVKIMK